MQPRRSFPVLSRVLLLVVAAAVLSSGCNPGTTPAARALHYLKAGQVKTPVKCLVDGRWVIDYPGDWPQYFHVDELPWFGVREVSPFMVAFVHHALTYAIEENAGRLGFTAGDIETAREMRRRAVTFMRRFESRPGEPDSGTYGFWPYDEDPCRPERPLAALSLTLLVGPIFRGTRVPVNIDFFPSALAIFPDADDTATIYSALLAGALLDGGAGSSTPFEQFFADWRDTGRVPRRLNPPWLPPASGAFLTWLSYRNPPDDSIPNDVDLVVNANVLWSLARHGRLDTPGVSESVALINRVVEQGLHRTRFHEVSDYYPDNFAFHYCVSRAYAEGPVPELEAAARILAADVERLAKRRADGTVYWGEESPHLATAFALLTLLNVGGDPTTLRDGIAYLVAEQDPVFGNWDECVFFIGRSEGGFHFSWFSASLTTAMAFEALCRYELERDE